MEEIKQTDLVLVTLQSYKECITELCTPIAGAMINTYA